MVRLLVTAAAHIQHMLTEAQVTTTEQQLASCVGKTTTAAEYVRDQSGSPEWLG
jgi:hypothetical protein